MTLQDQSRRTTMPVTHAGPRNLRRLLDAVLMIGTDLDLPAVLQRIVEAAVELVDARYGALGVLDESGDQLAEFITVGVDEDTHAAIGTLPKGLGLLGSLIIDAAPLRAARLGEHPDSSEFPPNHPSMTSFLGVPIKVRGEVFGNLYLTDKATSEVFTDIDEELALGLAAAAGIAIENARLYEHGRRREAVMAAMGDIATAVLAGTDRRSGLELVARRARELLGADMATIALLVGNDHDLVIDITDGPAAESLRDQRFDATETIPGDVLSTGEPAVVQDVAQHDDIRPQQLRAGSLGPAMFAALVADRQPVGILTVARAKPSAPFTLVELEVAQAFAAQASVILDHERGRQHHQQLVLAESQERVGRELQDTVIQRLFTAGLALQNASRLITDSHAKQCVSDAADDLDRTIAHIRTVIFDTEISKPWPARASSSAVDAPATRPPTTTTS